MPRAAIDGEDPRGQIFGVQRARMLAAMTEACAELGAPNVTIACVVERSGVSRRTFYELFADRESCLLAAFESALDRVGARVADAVAGDKLAGEGPAGDAQAGRTRWRERMRAGLLELLAFLDEDPAAGRLLVVESLAGGPRILERRAQALARVVAAVEEGRAELACGTSPPALAAESVVGAVCSVLYARLREDPPGELLGLANELMAVIVLPYLGAAAAKRELAHEIPASAGGARRAKPDPLRDLEMRVTYRTIRVLEAVAAHPGSSSREVGTAAGVADQGQISKLLARLEHLGLVANTTAAVRGYAKAWSLTSKGADVRDAIAGGLDGLGGRSMRTPA